ncbi:hypothetical protein EV643_12655 [Kribbella sp. VKM Ac-2527]|uniref:Uncharacterized protein n=1 Tax=Kribbella caucasensis TaxID=2512215 RepID=A0A4R6JJ56_9ACTN|nr:hypothetical protein [Kribbella sp. VKM Ac-2527]TDO34696.1 hypothetical protein EV643_12655 [Kribbella sp. VKM Ac-2527]
MKRFVVPPGWPTPPRRSWVPPKTWRPDPSWPPAPAGWRFWDDGKGNAVRGPVGLYGGTSRRAVFAGASGLMVFLAINIWALSAIGLFDGDDGRRSTMQAAPVLDDKSPTPTLTPTPTPTPPWTTQTPPAVTPTTVTPTAKPAKSRTSRKPEQTEESRTPTPTKSVTKPVRPPRTSTSTPPTREELLEEYCRQQGWDPEWCDPDNWPEQPEDPETPPPYR